MKIGYDFDEAQLALFAERIGAKLRGGEVFELIGDVGAGKTTFTKSLARGMGIDEPIQSPTFTISNRYESPRNLALVHYDFYRLHDAGIMQDELAETFTGERTVTVVEWADTVRGVLPADRIIITIMPTGEFSRHIEMVISDTLSALIDS